MKLDTVIAVRNNKTIYREGDRCLKVFNNDYSKSDVLNEALNHSRIEESGLSIPKLYEVTTIGGKWAIVMEFIKGKTIAQLLVENPEKAEEYLQLFVDIQLNIHTKKSLHLNKQKDKLNFKISQSDLSSSIRYELHSRLESIPKHNKVCHGDYNPSNIIIDETGVPFVIDWSHATQGNASADVARTYLLFCLKGETQFAERYLDLFCEKSNTAKPYVQKIMPIVAASQLVKGNAHEREFLYKWINVIEYQ